MENVEYKSYNPQAEINAYLEPAPTTTSVKIEANIDTGDTINIAEVRVVPWVRPSWLSQGVINHANGGAGGGGVLESIIFRGRSNENKTLFACKMAKGTELTPKMGNRCRRDHNYMYVCMYRTHGTRVNARSSR